MAGEQYYSGAQSCRSDGDHAACARAVITGSIALLTFFLCVARLLSLLRAKSDDEARLRSFKMIFALAVIMTGIMTYKWFYWAHVGWHFAVLYLSVCQFLVLCLFYSKLAFKAYGKAHMIKRVTWPVSGAVFVYFTVVLFVAAFKKQDNTVECKDSSWMMFSASTMVLSFIFIGAGTILTRAMDSFPTSESGKFWRKKLSLWSLIVSYLVMSLILFSFDVAFYAMADEKEKTCGNVFGHDKSLGYNVYKITDRLAMLLPIWVMLGVLTYKPKVQAATEDDDVDISVFAGSSGRAESDGSYFSWGDGGAINSVDENTPLMPTEYADD